MADTDARRLLAALAGDAPAEESTGHIALESTDYREPIDRAIAATEDLDAATTFLADADFTDLEAAIERAERDMSSRADEGRETLAQLREFRQAALG